MRARLSAECQLDVISVIHFQLASEVDSGFASLRLRGWVAPL